MTVKELEAQVVKALRTCYDPEIPVNIYELGIAEPGKVSIRMTLTAPNCPVAGSLPKEVQSRVARIPGVTEVNVELTWDPPWSMEKMSEAARLQLGVDPPDRSSQIARFGS
jgi:FeS assembly SUF system protein